MIEELPQHQKIVLLCIAKLLDENRQVVTPPEIKEYYIQICQEAGIRPRRPPQVWAFLKDLSRLGLIHQKIENRHNTQGRTLGRVALISIRDNTEKEIISSMDHLIEQFK